MIATKPSGRRANHTRNQRRWPNAWVLGVLLGLIVGGGTAWLYPPPSVDMIKVQSAEWYDSMRQLVFSTDTDTGAGNHEPSVYAQAPIQFPPEPHNDAHTDDALAADDVAELVNVNAALPDDDKLATVLDDAMDETEYKNRMVVADVATGKTLYDNGGDDPIVPASTLKLFTAVSALDQLGADHRFTTSAGYDPALGVVLTGGGDGLLSTGAGTGETVGYAGLSDLAQKTWDEISNQLTADPQQTIDVWADVSRYDEPWVHPTWNDGLMTSGWVSPIYPLNTYGGFYSDPSNDNTAVEDGASYAGGAFAQRLTDLAAAEGFDIEFRYSGQLDQPSDVETAAEVRSAPLGQQLEFAMKQSNNMLLEMFGREAAIAADNTPNFEGSTNTTMDTLEGLGISTESLEFVDNSGLSPNNHATLNSIMQLYEVILAQEHLRPILHSLTIAGYDGTMQQRMDQAPYSGIVRSKTGTLEVANSNVGLTVTDDGRTLWFGVNTTGAGQDYAGARDEQDGLIEALTDCNCSGK